jgi:hypothetical protein
MSAPELPPTVMVGSVCQHQDIPDLPPSACWALVAGPDTGRVPIDVDFTVVLRGYDIAAVDGIVQPYSHRPGIR